MLRTTPTSLLILSCALAQQVTAQPLVSIIRAPAPAAPVAVFGGELTHVSVSLYGVQNCESIVARLYQTAMMLQAPLNDWTPLQCQPAVSGSGSEAVRAEIEIAVPPVDAEIDLELRFARCEKPGDACKPFGNVPISALPADLLEPLNQWAIDHVLHVHDPFGVLTAFLEKREINYVSVGAVLPRDTEVVSLVVADEPLATVALTNLQRAGAVVLFREKTGPLPVVLQRDTVDGRLIDVRLPVVSRLASDPAAVKLFLDIFRMAQTKGQSR
jgi:hypothetical protein